MTKPATHRIRASSGELKRLVEQSKAALSNAGGLVTEEVSALRDRLRDHLGTFQVKVKTIAKSAHRQVARADDTIRSLLYQAIGIEAGVGLIAGLLIARRRAR